jgi:hypothetical protein
MLKNVGVERIVCVAVGYLSIRGRAGGFGTSDLQEMWRKVLHCHSKLTKEPWRKERAMTFCLSRVTESGHVQQLTASA